ncbi:hypothetical protein ACSQ67_017303 [Phaseolus vulgaris]
MKGVDGVVSVIPNRVYNVQTSRSWDFLNFPENVPRTNVEGNTIVGVIDSGIWISNSNSFTDGGFGPPPPKWKGTCNNFTCNNKVIGARYFRMGGVFTPEDIISPTDTSGHGSHCASTAAGNRVPNANLLGLGSGIARGGVPSARIAVYKVCWTKGCETIDILAGFDAAVADGVDIISISVGPTKVQHLEYFQDDIAIGAYHAMKSGILTSKTADNLGPNRYTMVNLAPWFLSVAATTIDRKFFTDLKLGNGQVIQGVSVNTFIPTQTNGYPLIYGGDVPAPGFNSSESRLCRDNSLNGALVSGRIVLCEGYTSSFRLGFASGAAGVIFTTTPLNSALNPDAEFAYGAGQINPLKAVNPGLVYDVGPNDYINFLCGQGYSTTTLRRITGDNNTCTSANRGSVFNLNLPSFALATARSSYNSVSYGRTITNVGSARSTYRAIVSGYPSSLNIQVVPNVLTFTSLGQRLSFTLRIQGTINADLDSFSLTWDDGTHQVRSPIVVYVP